MAVTAKFLADFTDFDKKVEAAEATIKDFGLSVANIDQNLKKFANQFSGAKVIAEATLMAQAVEAIGGKSKLTEQELLKVGRTAAEAVEKMTALGLKVPAQIQTLADAVSPIPQKLTLAQKAAE